MACTPRAKHCSPRAIYAPMRHTENKKLAMKHILFAFFVVLLHPKTKTMMKNCVYILLSLLTMVGCAGRKGEGHPAGADSLYTYTFIF